MSPLDAAWQQLISTLHASGRKAALAITGGGSGAVGALLRVPGGSRLLIEAQVPYDALALAAFLSFAPARACSSDTAIAMAQSARARAARLVPAGTDLVGLGATAALVTRASLLQGKKSMWRRESTNKTMIKSSISNT